MSSKGMSSKGLPLERYFSNSYASGRQKFQKLCADKNLSIQAFVNPALKGPNGEDLAMDCVWVGPKTAQKVLLVTCGTHGLEAATGAATLLQLLDSDILENLPDELAILLIHAVNPYGWAYAHRVNEDGIDLNRNCLDHNQPYPDNLDYDKLHIIIKDAKIDDAGLSQFVKAFHNYGENYGTGHAISGIVAGQYNQADGIGYGGIKRSWSCKTLFAIAEKYLSHAEKIIHIDWHTGIGEFGEAFFIIDDPVTSHDYKMASQWWSPHIMHSEDILENISPDYSGLVIRGLKEKITSFNPAQIISVVIEWGTYDIDTMLEALLIDNRLKNNSGVINPLAEQARKKLIERFYPAKQSWRQGVLTGANPIYQQAIKGLQDW
jgi:hypothetical protein